MKPHFNPENIYYENNRFIYIDEDDVEHDITDNQIAWKCDLGHKWLDTLANRSAGANCPICGKVN